MKIRHVQIRIITPSPSSSSMCWRRRLNADDMCQPTSHVKYSIPMRAHTVSRFAPCALLTYRTNYFSISISSNSSAKLECDSLYLRWFDRRCGIAFVLSLSKLFNILRHFCKWTKCMDENGIRSMELIESHEITGKQLPWNSFNELSMLTDANSFIRLHLFRELCRPIHYAQA